MLVTGESLKHVRLENHVTVRGNTRDKHGIYPRFRVTHYEAVVLIDAATVQAHVSPKTGDLYFLELIVPLQAYFRILKGIRSPEAPANITRARQVRGAKRWAVRLDRARTGNFRRDTVVFIPRELTA